MCTRWVPAGDGNVSSGNLPITISVCRVGATRRGAGPLSAFGPACGQRWGACINTHCASLSVAKASTLGVRLGNRSITSSWRDGLICGKRVRFAGSTFRIVDYSGKRSEGLLRKPLLWSVYSSAESGQSIGHYLQKLHASGRRIAALVRFLGASLGCERQLPG